MRLLEKWPSARIGDLFDIQQGKALSPSARNGKNLKPFLRTANVLWNRIDITSLDAMHFAPAEQERLRLREGDLLVCEGGEVGRAAVWEGVVAECFYQNHVHRLRPRGRDVLPEFAMYWLRVEFTQFRRYAGVANRTTIPNLSATRLKNFEMPLPPPHEQRAIVAAISGVDEALRTQERAVDVTRELKHATMAKLFREGVHREPLKNSEIGEIPASWDVRELATGIRKINYGTSMRCTTEVNGRPVLRIPNVVRGKIEPSDLKYANLGASDVERYELLPGDLLFVRTNGNRDHTGRCAVYSGQPKNALFASYLIRVRLADETWLPGFVEAYLNSAGRHQLSSRANGAADGKFNIDTGVIKQVLVPRPTIAEQHDILLRLQTVDHGLVVAERRRDLLSELLEGTLSTLLSRGVR